MPLVECRDCGKQIGKSAKQCISCGAILKRGLDWPNLAINFLFMSIAVISLFFAIQSDDRAEKMFTSNIKPLIQNRPIDFEIAQAIEGTTWRTKLEVINYSGFDAFNITSDLKYGTNDWLVEWFMANKKKLEEKNALGKPLTDWEKKELINYEPPIIKKLEAGHRVETRVLGAAPSRSNFCETARDHEKIFVRTAWANEKGHTFDLIREYTLLCTFANGGRHYSFIPENIVSPEE